MCSVMKYIIAILARNIETAFTVYIKGEQNSSGLLNIFL